MIPFLFYLLIGSWLAVLVIWTVLQASRPVRCVNCCDTGEYWAENSWHFCHCPAGREAAADYREATR